MTGRTWHVCGVCDWRQVGPSGDLDAAVAHALAHIGAPPLSLPTQEEEKA